MRFYLLTHPPGTPQAKPVYFDSQKIPKAFVDPADSHPATTNQGSDQWLSIILTVIDNDLRAQKEAELDRNRVMKIADRIGKHLVGLVQLVGSNAFGVGCCEFGTDDFCTLKTIRA